MKYCVVIRHSDRKSFLASTRRSENPFKCGTQKGRKGLMRESFFLLIVLSPPMRDGSVTTDLRQKGACNQGKEVLKFLFWGVARRHSLGY
jgi:hypothetical protein